MRGLTSRDIEIIEKAGLFCGLTSSQIASMFGMNIKVCQRRLRKLVKADYLRAMSLPVLTQGRSPSLFYPGKAAESILKVPYSKPRLSPKLTHQQNNTEILVKIMDGLKDTDIRCEIMPEHVIRTFSEKYDVIPDGAIMLERMGKRALFLFENCEGTESVKSKLHEDIQHKFARYLETYEADDTNHYEEYFKAKFKRFRLLFIANSKNRMASISKLAAQIDDEYGFIWLTTIEQLVSEGIRGNIWNIPSKGITGKAII